MPKINNTRKQRAEELYNRIMRGPSFDEWPPTIFNSDEATRQYKIWIRSWIQSELIDLIPELKHLKDE